jgi:hypothetical protein
MLYPLSYEGSEQHRARCRRDPQPIANADGVR